MHRYLANMQHISAPTLLLMHSKYEQKFICPNESVRAKFMIAAAARKATPTAPLLEF